MKFWGSRLTLVELVAISVVLLLFVAMLAPVVGRVRDTARHGRWSSFQRELVAHEGVLVAYPLVGASGKTIQNEAKTPQSFRGYDPIRYRGELWGDVEWGRGRWSRKTALVFDGEGDFVSCGTFDVERDQEPVKELTILAWVRVSQLDVKEACIVTKASGNHIDDNWFALGVLRDGGSVHVYFRLKTDTEFATTELLTKELDFPFDEWIHLGARYDGGEMQVYLNGKLVGKMDKAGDVARQRGTRVLLGDGPRGGRGLVGAIDELEIFCQAIKPEEILYHYRVGRP